MGANSRDKMEFVGQLVSGSKSSSPIKGEQGQILRDVSKSFPPSAHPSQMAKCYFYEAKNEKQKAGLLISSL